MLIFNPDNPLEVNEGDGQIVIAIDPVASEITEPAEVEIFTLNGSAISTDLANNGVGVDFSAIEPTIVNLDPNDPDSLNISVAITEDAIAEPNENFQFRVRGIEDSSLDTTATVTILDNDGTDEPEFDLEVELLPEPEPTVEGLLPRITIDDLEQIEGNSGDTNFEFIVTLSEPSDTIVSVDYATADGTAEAEARFEDLTLIDAADYIPINGTVEFVPGETEQSISVSVIADNEVLSAETADETFFINLSNASNADLQRNVGIGTILNDDLETESTDSELPTIEFGDRIFPEGDLGENIPRELTVSLIDGSGELFIATEDVTFTFQTVDLNAVADIDFEFIDEQTGAILAGESSASIELTIFGDEDIELDESLIAVLSEIDPNLVQLGDEPVEATITIEDDDAVDNDSDASDNINDGDGSNVEEPESNNDLNDSTEDGDLTDNTVFRFLDTETGGYFYTASETERESAESLGNFEPEDPSFASVDPDVEDAVDVFRFFNSDTGGYLYTTSERERDFIEDNLDEFVFEDVAFSAFANDVGESIPVYRFFEGNTGIHFYTANETERTFVEDNLTNFSFEGIAFYALPLETDVL